MWKVVLAVLVSLAVSGPAQALSCLPSDVARTFALASEAEENYVILHGTFAFTQPARHDPNTSAPPTIQFPATFEGRYLAADGFVDAPPLDVTVEFQCLAEWCGSMTAGEDTVAFVQQTHAGYLLRIDPCFGSVFDATDLTLQRVTSCMRGTGCHFSTR